MFKSSYQSYGSKQLFPDIRRDVRSGNPKYYEGPPKGPARTNDSNQRDKTKSTLPAPKFMRDARRDQLHDQQLAIQRELDRYWEKLPGCRVEVGQFMLNNYGYVKTIASKEELASRLPMRYRAYWMAGAETHAILRQLEKRCQDLDSCWRFVEDGMRRVSAEVDEGQDKEIKRLWGGVMQARANLDGELCDLASARILHRAHIYQAQRASEAHEELGHLYQAHESFLDHETSARVTAFETSYRLVALGHDMAASTERRVEQLELAARIAEKRLCRYFRVFAYRVFRIYLDEVEESIVKHLVKVASLFIRSELSPKDIFWQNTSYSDPYAMSFLSDLFELRVPGSSPNSWFSGKPADLTFHSWGPEGVFGRMIGKGMKDIFQSNSEESTDSQSDPWAYMEMTRGKIATKGILQRVNFQIRRSPVGASQRHTGHHTAVWEGTNPEVDRQTIWCDGRAHQQLDCQGIGAVRRWKAKGGAVKNGESANGPCMLDTTDFPSTLFQSK
jgi:hypothetical protein